MCAGGNLFVQLLPDGPHEGAPAEEQQQIHPERQFCRVALPVEGFFVFWDVGVVVCAGAVVEVRVEAQAADHDVHGGRQHNGADNRRGYGPPAFSQGRGRRDRRNYYKNARYRSMFSVGVSKIVFFNLDLRVLIVLLFSLSIVAMAESLKPTIT